MPDRTRDPAAIFSFAPSAPAHRRVEDPGAVPEGPRGTCERPGRLPHAVIWGTIIRGTCKGAVCFSAVSRPSASAGPSVRGVTTLQLPPARAQRVAHGGRGGGPTVRATSRQALLRGCTRRAPARLLRQRSTPDSLLPPVLWECDTSCRCVVGPAQAESRHATSLWQGNWCSVAIGLISKSTQ